MGKKLCYSKLFAIIETADTTCSTDQSRKNTVNPIRSAALFVANPAIFDIIIYVYLLIFSATRDSNTDPPGLWEESFSMRRGITACLIFFLMSVVVLCASTSTAERALTTREYFENLDRDSRLQDIVENAGNYSIEGSGILYYVWPLNDGSRAKIVFDSTGRIVMIYIVGENGSERIYKREYQNTGSDTDPAAESESIDIDEAAWEMGQAIREQMPPAFYPNPAQQGFELFDVTGDGCADLCTCVTWGSGMVRTDLVVYDPAVKSLYVLDGYNYSYLIDHVEEDRIVIAMKGPYGSENPILTTFGTVKTEDGRIVFVPDSEAR